MNFNALIMQLFVHGVAANVKRYFSVNRSTGCCSKCEEMSFGEQV